MRIEDREKLFENPAGEYRGRPFWAWNGKLTEEELLRQIDIFRQMGFSGFFIGRIFSSLGSSFHKYPELLAWICCAESLRTYIRCDLRNSCSLLIL